MDPGWITAATALAVAVVGCVAWFGRKAWHLLRRAQDFLDDWGGHPPRAGVPAKPGVMARLASQEESLAHVVAETSPNHGRSIRDIVLRTAADVGDIKQEQLKVRGELERIQEGKR